MLKDNKTHIVRRPYDDVCLTVHPFGESEEMDYRLVRDSHGNCEYVEIGKRNISDYVESFKNGCSLKAILDRCQLMPVRDKIAYLNQTEQSMSADLSCMPKDGTEAQIMIQKVKAICPDFAKRLRNGESFEKLIVELLPNSGKYAETVAPDPVSHVVNNNESEVTQ